MRSMLILLVTILLFVPHFSFGQSTGTIPPFDNLYVDGIPDIPTSIAEAIGRYTEFRSASMASWHPTKTEMLIITRFADVPQVHHVKMPGGDRTQLTFFPDRVGSASFNPKRDDYFIFTKDVGGGEWFQIFRFDVATGTITMLTDGKSRNTLGPWSQAGDKIAYTSTRRNGKDTDIYVIDPANPQSDRLLAKVEGGGWQPVDWSPDGSKLLVIEGISINESYLWLFDGTSGESTLLTPKEPGVQIARSSAEFSRDGKGIYLTSDRDSEFLRLAYVDLASKAHTILSSHINWDVSSFDLSPDGKTIAFVSNEDGISVLRLMDTRTRKEIKTPPLPIGVISGVRWHKDGTRIGFNISSARSSTDVYSLDVKKSKVERWTFSETGGINVDSFAEPELVRWTSFDGREISGFLYEPPSRFKGKRPVIVSIHGGPESQFRPTFLGRNNYFLNEVGVAILYPNIRGSSGYGKTFLKLDNDYKRVDSYKDIEALLDWIKKHPGLDGDRILVTGGSYGGHMTLAISTNYAEKIRCAIAVVGMSNLVTFLENTESYRRDLRRVEYGDERDPEMRAFLEKIAPLNNADKIMKPLFIVQGKNDPRVPYTESEQMVATLKKNNTPVWYLMGKDEGHGFAKKKNQDFQMYATVLFMQEFLLK